MPRRLFVGVGLLGGFTTFSAFSLEMMLLIERGSTPLALTYAVRLAAGRRSPGSTSALS